MVAFGDVVPSPRMLQDVAMLLFGSRAQALPVHRSIAIRGTVGWAMDTVLHQLCQLEERDCMHAGSGIFTDSTTKQPALLLVHQQVSCSLEERLRT